MRVHRVVVAGATAAVSLAVAVPAQAATPQPHPTRVGVKNAQLSLRAATPLQGAPVAQAVSLRLYLALPAKERMMAAVKAVSDPRSSSYGHYLTPAQVTAAYSPDEATVAALRTYLAGFGIEVTSVPSNRLWVDATATVAQAQKAFGTSLRQYRLDGKVVRAAATPVTLPAALAGKVSAVSGLATRQARIRPDHVDGAPLRPRTVTATQAPAATPSRAATRPGAPPSPAFVNAPPCSAYWAEKTATSAPAAYGKKQPYVTCGYTWQQLQGAYGLTQAEKYGFDGRGVTVAITDAYASPTIVADADAYAVKHGQKPFAKGQFTQVLPRTFTNGYDDTGANKDTCGEQGWYGEETLDVEAVHAVAPGARITYVAGASCHDDDLMTALNTIVEKRLAHIVTNSWGGTDEAATEQDAYTSIFFQGALEGIGFYYSSGDSGDAAADNNGVPTPEAPANNPLVTAVGGTSAAIGKNNQRIFETGWSTDKSTLTKGAWTPPPPGTYAYGAGGGTSQVFSQPFYQQGVVPAAFSQRFDAEPARVVPDVAAVGDPNTGFLVGQTQTFPDTSVKYSEYRIGGTSLSSPLFAGIMAISDQVSGRPHGFANPALYSLAGTPAYYDPRRVTGVGVVRVDYVNMVDASGGTTTSLRTLDAEDQTTLRTRRGYDTMTGVGTVNGSAFLARLGVGH